MTRTREGRRRPRTRGGRAPTPSVLRIYDPPAEAFGCPSSKPLGKDEVAMKLRVVVMLIVGLAASFYLAWKAAQVEMTPEKIKAQQPEGMRK